MSRARYVVLAVLAVLSVNPADAAAQPAPGGVLVTCHDPDFHATEPGGDNPAAISFLQKSVRFVTGGAADPEVLLVTHRDVPDAGHRDPYLGLQAAGYQPDMADDGTAGGAVLDVGTVDFSAYDVVIVASDFGGWLTQAELDELVARRDAVMAYVNAGGGLLALAESGELTTANQYGFLPFIVSSTGNLQAEESYTVTPYGASQGFVNEDVNGNFSHCSIDQTGGLEPIDRDGRGQVMSAAARGRTITASGAAPAPTATTTPPSSTCDPNYDGACVPENVDDVDCTRTANGPAYVDARDFRVVGLDHYELDADGDRIACESVAGVSANAGVEGLPRTGISTTVASFALGTEGLALGALLLVLARRRVSGRPAVVAASNALTTRVR